jgi:hypothetical protein
MATLNKWQKEQIAKNNAIVHGLEVGARYHFTFSYPSHITKTLEGTGIYVGKDHVDNNGFMMAMFKMDGAPLGLSGFRYDALATLKCKKIESHV